MQWPPIAVRIPRIAVVAVNAIHRHERHENSGAAGIESREVADFDDFRALHGRARLRRERLLDGDRKILFKKQRLMRGVSEARDRGEFIAGIGQQEQRRQECRDMRAVTAQKTSADESFGFSATLIMNTANIDAVCRRSARAARLADYLSLVGD